MELVLAIVCGVIFGASVWFILAGDPIRFLLGLAMMSNGVNLAIFAAGRLVWAAPPLIEQGASVPEGAVSNALPQALILTAIVISFGLLSFMVALLFRARDSR